MLLANQTMLFDRDEARFARAAIEMLTSGEFIVPTFNGELRDDKPVLVYWLMMPWLMLLGPIELAVRMPSCLGMAFSGLLTYFMTIHLLDDDEPDTADRPSARTTALRAQLFFGTCLLCLWIGTAATADGTLILGMSAALYGWVRCLPRGCGVLAQNVVQDVVPNVAPNASPDEPLTTIHARWTRGAWLWFLGGLAWGQLTKGPIGLLIPVLAVIGTHGAAVLMRLHAKRQGNEQAVDPIRFAGPFRRLFWLAIALSLLPLLAWGAAAGFRTDWVLVSGMWQEHVVDRALRPAEGHGGSTPLMYTIMVPLYVLLIIGTFFPWTLFLPAGISGLCRGSIGSPALRCMLWGWLVPSFIMLSLIATKLPHYVLGLYPALAILSAAALQAHADGRLTKKDRDWLKGGTWFFSVIAFAGIVGLLGVPWFFQETLLGVLALPAGFLLAVATMIVIANLLSERVNTILKWVTPLLVACLLAVFFILSPRAEPDFKVSEMLGRELNNALAEYQTPQDVALGMYGYKEPSLVFYSNLPYDQPIRELANREELADFLRADGPGLLFVPADTLDEEYAKDMSLNYRVLAEANVINYADHAKDDRILLVERLTD